MRAENPTAEVIEVHVPETSSSPIEVSINPDDKTYWQTDYRYFDQYTLKELSVDHIYGRSEEAKAADKLLRMNYSYRSNHWLARKDSCILCQLNCRVIACYGILYLVGEKK